MMVCASIARSSEGSRGKSDTRKELQMSSSAYFHRQAALKDRVPFHRDVSEPQLARDCLATPVANQHCCVALALG